MIVEIFEAKDIKDISSELLMDNNKLRLFPAEYYKNFRYQDFRTFCHNHARYGIPTIQLVDFIKNKINGRSAIEIGAGCGDLGYHLNIPMTDSFLQDREEIKKLYELAGQPVIKYGKDVERFEAIEAIHHFKPKVAIASWITSWGDPNQIQTRGFNPDGVKEDKILNSIDTFIFIGNLDVHHDKPIMKIPHEELYFPWIVSRAKSPENNRIFIWDKK